MEVDVSATENIVPQKIIPLIAPKFDQNEQFYVQKCIESNWVAYNGPMVVEFEKRVAEYTQSPFVVATNTGTSALHLSLICLNVQKDDLVIASGLSFIAPANAIRYTGAEPIFIDADPMTWQMSYDLLKEFLMLECEVNEQNCFHKATGRRIPCLVIVHELGYSGNIQSIVELCHKHLIKVIEDAAGAFGSFYKEKHLGTFGDIGCFSFNGNKIITTSGGGAILTSNSEIAERALHLSTQAKLSEDYFHKEPGYNYRMTNLSAALGLGQIERIELFLAGKKAVYQKYINDLSQVQEIEYPKYSKELNPNHWIFQARFKNAKELCLYLNKKGIQARPLWVPLNTLPHFSNCLFYSKENHSQAIFDSALCLPSSYQLENEELHFIVSEIQKFYNQE